MDAPDTYHVDNYNDWSNNPSVDIHAKERDAFTDKDSRPMRKERDILDELVKVTDQLIIQYKEIMVMENKALQLTKQKHKLQIELRNFKNGP